MFKQLSRLIYFGIFVCALMIAPKRANAIVGGNEVNTLSVLGRMVARIDVENKDGSGSSCSGTFVDRFTVLTAAHCLPARAGSNIRIWWGNEARVSFGTVGVRFKIHPGYKGEEVLPEAGVDLALIKTRDPLPADFKISAIASNVPFEGMDAVASGYGVHGYWDSFVAQISAYVHPPYPLKMVRLRIQLRPWWSFSHLLNTSDSASNGTSNGDSGGPLLATENGRLVQVGVLSGFLRDEKTLGPRVSVWTSLVKYESWILAESVLLSR